jgi:2'-5' RNA ligase
VTAAAVRLRRLFFALWPDEATREALRRTTRATVRHSGGKPVPAENYHITLAFLGNVADEHFDAIVSAARQVPVEPVTLTLDRYGYFPAPQVLWIGAAETPEPLRRLSADVWGAIAKAGLAAVPRPLHAHLTLARKVAAEPELTPPRPVAWRVAGFVLVESDTDPDGARYRVLERFKDRA